MTPIDPPVQGGVPASGDPRTPRTPVLGTPASDAPASAGGPPPGTPPPGSSPSPDAVPGAPAPVPLPPPPAVPDPFLPEPPPTTAAIALRGLPGRRQPEVPAPPPSGARDDPEWYRTAVFYEVMLRTFADSGGNGSGDLPGLVQRLDYLQWLGVDCLWLPPFYPSPLRDGGYDVSDYTAVAPQYGTLDDFRTLVTECHRRGMRIVVDLVMNHTSDQHPWFHASRSDPDGPYGDFYVWSDDNTRYQDARIIFVDTETSNWTFDPVRRQYFWHRFFSHQPDLNFENPRVVDAMLDVARFWLHLGVDGFRLDAVPYLFEAEGTNCENLPETHEFLRKVRRVIDEEFPGRIMLAEANQWPEDVVHYFGTDDEPECHMCFHFPVMPRIYYALRDQRATQIVDILADTPPIPAGGQWSTFLRNHDELTLEMVSTEERASMYGWYAPDSRMRANVGIRRRLAPLLDNSRKEIELAHALLLSLPGSPCLYYGDEIGMGDNIWLADRDAVRTPMQWTPDRNAGFSTADPGKLYLPLVQSLVYHYGNVNVESQLAQPTSLLHWVHGMLAVRRQHPALGRGTFEVVPCDNESVLAFLRQTDEETILVVANLAATARAATVTIQTYAGWTTRDVFGGAHFPDVAADGTITFTLGSREFYWLELGAP
ncbi:maltose alpha-D-glucosyltransferase [Cellulomonas wangsupingiae]|uniref:maltose alpha-D-glucosyltransferase n=1 Tax=Cellulomonas wangsupingiae TaxID=2968085 RepID=UPI001D0DD4F8|nr:maltose alpha-D-glucosyltransferase [Cellulomonas wangsupingiae]MCM0638426.1 maltose alpha-D-glucosyltransferase [Cellulomonas wangsupingiae]